MSKKEKAETYNVFLPKSQCFLLGRLDTSLRERSIDRDMHSTTALPVGALETIVDQVERGVATKKAMSLLVAPALGWPSRKDCFLLGEFVRKHSKSETIKYKRTTKVDWTSARVRNQVQDFLSKGKSLAHVAKYLGVSKSTLTKANKRHQYRFYFPKGVLV